MISSTPRFNTSNKFINLNCGYEFKWTYWINMNLSLKSLQLSLGSRGYVGPHNCVYVVVAFISRMIFIPSHLRFHPYPHPYSYLNSIPSQAFLLSFQLQLLSIPSLPSFIISFLPLQLLHIHFISFLCSFICSSWHSLLFSFLLYIHFVLLLPFMLERSMNPSARRLGLPPSFALHRPTSVETVEELWRTFANS